VDITIKIFELEGLICKIFGAKELAKFLIIYRLNIQIHDYLGVCLEVKGRNAGNKRIVRRFPILGRGCLTQVALCYLLGICAATSSADSVTL